MNYFLDKLPIYIIILSFFSCNDCSKINFSDFEKEISNINEIKNIILKNETNSIDLKKDDIKKIVKTKYFKILEKLDVNSIYNINDVIIFKFQTKNKSSFVIKNESICNYYLFYGVEKKTKNNIIHYEQFSECRIKLKDINENWSILYQKIPCTD